MINNYNFDNNIILNSILTSLVVSSYKIQASLVICFANNGKEVY